MATIDDILSNGSNRGTQAGSVSQTPNLSIPEQETVTIAPQKMKVSQGIMVPGGKQKDGNAGQPGVRPPRLSYEEMFRLANPNPIPSQGQLAAEKRKQKRQQVLAALGDGISALSNLYFTSQYAPNMFSAGKSKTSQLNDRFERLEKERQANMRAYIDGLARARQADDAYNDNQRQWERIIGLDKVKAERDKAADARAEAKEQRDQEMHDLDKQLMNNQITQSEYEAKKAEVEARYAPQLEESKIGRNRAAAGASNASASASRARARYYDNGGSSGNRYYGEFQGNTYKTQADYEKAVLDAAREAGVDIYDTEVTERNYNGEPRKSRRVKRSIAAIAAEVETAAASRPDLQRYRRSNGTQTPPPPPLDK